MIGKSGDPVFLQAASLARKRFSCQFLTGRRTEPFPKKALLWRGDYIISYLSPWIIPETLLARASKAAMNFHPGPPEYPGIGCTNFAVYNDESRFGVTCHHMAARVDTGSIIAVRRFPLRPSDSVYALTQRCYKHILRLFDKVTEIMATGRPLPVSREEWARKPFKRVQLTALCRVSPSMSREEIERRIRATTYPGMPGVYVEIQGLRFELSPLRKDLIFPSACYNDLHAVQIRI